mmetsp:Transcript_75850/g.175860  ORF Transcript_75850/g.175860 Transcript_75850/m.175860 type:complete len:366 (+) Transcript_75850:80-1177(+)
MADAPVETACVDVPAFAVDDAQPCEALSELHQRGTGAPRKLRESGGLAGNKSRRIDAAQDCVEVADLERPTFTSSEVVDIKSDSSSSSDTDSSSRSRSQRRSKSVGAAAATALLTAVEPLDVDVGERQVEKELQLPTSFAARLQHEGGTVVIMVETGAQISIWPREGDPNESIVRLVGTEHAVGRAVASLEMGHLSHKKVEAAAPTPQVLAQVEIPAQFLNAVVGPNAETISEVRAACKGIMIALQPSEQSGGPTTAFIGPSDRELVAHAERQIRERLLLAEAGAEAAADARDEPAEARECTAVALETVAESIPTTAETPATVPGGNGPDDDASGAGTAPAQEVGEAAGDAREKGSDSDGLGDIP